jgi:subtilisin family serine protease
MRTGAQRATRRIPVAVLAAIVVVIMTTPAADAAVQGRTRNYVVVYKQGVTLANAKRAVRAIGGRVVSAQPAVRAMLVRSSRTHFRRAAFRSRLLKGAVLNQVIGRATPRKPDPIESAGRGDGGVTVSEPPSGLTEPLAGWQWDMRMIGATPEGSYGTELGSKDVIVAVIDTGIDASHPDIAPNFNKGLSRNWTTDIPSIDGPCEEPSCVDPNDVDQDGHGTHVAGTIASPINGLGMAGVAPNVTLVNDRAGQDSGSFFLDETVHALVYAAQIGADVANMSFYTDPWQYNCPGSHPAVSPDTGEPADSPEQQREQELVLNLVQNAVDYAVAHGVTLVAAAGNDHNDLDGSKTDTTSPDYPAGNERVRVVSDWCRDMPTEADGVISVSSVGPSGAKADYSNYGAGAESGGAGDDPAGEIDVAAPGGYFGDLFGTPDYRLPQNEILGPYPLAVARAAHDVDAAGNPTSASVVRDCSGESGCAYYQLIQGTSMASPHAAGVAALIVSKYGTPDPVHGGLTMDPGAVRERLRATASDHACPDPATVDYTTIGDPATWDATCEGTLDYNGFYGDGIVDAQAAVGG